MLAITLKLKLNGDERRVENELKTEHLYSNSKSSNIETLLIK